MAASCQDCSSCSARHSECSFEHLKDKYSNQKTFVYNKQQHSQPISMVLGLTARCNLKCTYCFVSQKPADMTYSTANYAVQWFKSIQQANKRKEKMDIVFFGGEPLLKYKDIIVPIVKKWGEQSHFSITTNGVLLDEDKVDFLYKNQIGVLLSFDGVPEVQNTQRTNSFDKVLKNIPYLLLRLPHTCMRSTVTRQSIKYLYDSVLMAAELGFTKVSFVPNAYEDWDKEAENELYEQFYKIGQYIYKNLRKTGSCIKVDPIIKYFSKISNGAENKLRFNNQIMRCGLGTTSCAITPAGDIVPCQEKISNPTAVIGNVYTGIDPELHKKFLYDYYRRINNIQCNNSGNCSAREKLMCLSDQCPSRLEDLDYGLTTSHCAFNRVITKVASRLHFLCAYSNYETVRYYFEEN